MISRVLELNTAQKEDIRRIWNQEYPHQFVHPDLASLEGYLQKLGKPIHFLITEADQIQGWLVTFNRDGARWFSIILDSSIQGKGLGSQLLNAAKKEEIELNGWATDHERDVRADGQAYASPIGFYLKNGFEVLKGTRLEQGLNSLVKIQWKR